MFDLLIQSGFFMLPCRIPPHSRDWGIRHALAGSAVQPHLQQPNQACSMASQQSGQIDLLSRRLQHGIQPVPRHLPLPRLQSFDKGVLQQLKQARHHQLHGDRTQGLHRRGTKWSQRLPRSIVHQHFGAQNATLRTAGKWPTRGQWRCQPLRDGPTWVNILCQCKAQRLQLPHRTSCVHPPSLLCRFHWDGSGPGAAGLHP